MVYFICNIYRVEVLVQTEPAFVAHRFRYLQIRIIILLAILQQVLLSGRGLFLVYFLGIRIGTNEIKQSKK
jgi:hypothetical protein